MQEERDMSDLIDRGIVLDALDKIEEEVADGYGYMYEKWRKYIAEMPATQSTQDFGKDTNVPSNDCISRQAAIDALDVLCQEHRYRIPGKRETYSQYNEAWQDALDRAEGAIGNVPSAQPEQRTCVNCGRTVNSGGWYADGGTRCPIEEHYALPKDGYCHLWEKRNVTDDDYPERREE
jgi:hypothetical protein